ncbi:MAG: NAD(P)-dependent oxidoreductase [Proteobacteria bacterium]|nr:NAD(P)-dependent oxidoreductase [Pseudomonadota bacterium]MBU1687394.1 NAD(P)-dependent oxidoreductase [Pseudomonadota bacterium]
MRVEKQATKGFEHVRRLGVLIGGSGLIGGALMHYFKTKTGDELDILSPNSKKLSLREPEDILSYFRRYRPDFIINTAIASIDSDPKMAYEVNYLGSINLARVALALKIPYIHFSSAAIMPNGENLAEDDVLPLTEGMSNYAKSKLMSEITLRQMHEEQGLDYTIIRLGVVYGKHDHKIQGFHRLLFSVMNQAMPVLFTRRGVMHSYTHSKKLPPFVHHILDHRQEFSGETYNFVDPSPVGLAELILTIRSYLELSRPKNIYLPYPLARAGRLVVEQIVKGLCLLGIEARLPGELMFMENFYKTQTLSAEKLARSSFRDPYPGFSVFSKLPDMIEYYLTRWEHLNLISFYNKDFFDPQHQAEVFLRNPQELLEKMVKDPFPGLDQ